MDKTRTLDHAGEVRAGEELDWIALESYLKQHLPAAEGTMKVSQFHGGHANLTYLVKFGDVEYVLRRPPFGRLAPGAHDMKREYKVLSKLPTYFAPAPRAHLLCTDHTVIGSDFIVMDRREGVILRKTIPAPFVGMDQIEERLTDALVRVIADLHTVDVEEAGLEDLGRAEGFMQRQLKGWTKRWHLSKTEENSDVEAVLSNLEGSVPAPQRVSIVHGDMKFDNCQFKSDDPDTVTSVFDWDMATIGDPLLDLSGTLSYWPDPEIKAGSVPIMLEGNFPNKEFIKQRYAKYSGLDLSNIQWYEAFSCFKTAVIAQQLYRRFHEGDTKDKRMAFMIHASRAMAQLARKKLA